MRLLHSAARTQAAFDNENVVSFAGLEPVMRLAQDAGLHDVVGQRVRLGTSIGSNPAGKIATIVAGMIAGADSIDDLDALRHGGMGELFGQVLGLWVRAGLVDVGVVAVDGTSPSSDTSSTTAASGASNAPAAQPCARNGD